MMNLVEIRDRAAARQAAAHQNRSFHRERQKECEREDQTMKKVVRSINDLLAAQAQFGAVMQDISPELLTAIGAAEKPVPTVVTPAPEPELTPAPKPVTAAEPKGDQLDNDVLLIMRANRRPDGVCLLRPSEIAAQAGVHVGALNVGPLRRLAAKGLIKRTTEGRYIVAEKPAAKSATAAPVESERLPPTSQTKALELRLLEHLRRAADPNGMVLIDGAVLAKKLETTPMRIEDALLGLAASGHAVRRKSGLKGHLTIELLTKAAAE